MDYICHTCHSIIDRKPCPVCGEIHLEEMCKDDPGECHCAHTIHESIVICNSCGQPVCPGCGSHSVVAISRVTGSKSKSCASLHGNLQDVSGWNNGKIAELKDRVRTKI